MDPRIDAALPPLPLAAWQDTRDTLHMWMQVVGKVALATSALTNHYWNAALVLTPRGLATHPLFFRDVAFAVTFDFVADRLVIEESSGGRRELALEPMSVAAFYERLMGALRDLGIDVHIWTTPVEVARAIPFERDVEHCAYDAAQAHAFFRVLVGVEPVFERFRAGFVGKSSPLHFFWGAFDLALTRFSGRRTPTLADDPVQREAYSHEVISHGFWPGGGGYEDAAFYAYAAPEPAGFASASVSPPSAFYSDALREMVLPYEAVRTSPSPSSALGGFLETTYTAAADLARWDRESLERRILMACSHLAQVTTLKAPGHVCEECVRIGSGWVHLRTCETCGVTLCCDSSPNRHARAHALAAGHPVIASAEPGEQWLYCFVDEELADIVGVPAEL